MIKKFLQVSEKESEAKLFCERLFLSDSFDNVKALVDHNMTEFYPQLIGCPLVEALKYKKFKRGKVDRQAYKVMLLWHQERLERV